MTDKHRSCRKRKKKKMRKTIILVVFFSRVTWVENSYLPLLHVVSHRPRGSWHFSNLVSSEKSDFALKWGTFSSSMLSTVWCDSRSVFFLRTYHRRLWWVFSDVAWENGSCYINKKDLTIAVSRQLHRETRASRRLETRRSHGGQRATTTLCLSPLLLLPNRKLKPKGDNGDRWQPDAGL